MQRLSIAPAFAANAPQLLDLAPQPAHSDDEECGIETLCFTYIINVTSSYYILLRVFYLKQSTFQFGWGGGGVTQRR
jgi:hypothetical protein